MDVHDQEAIRYISFDRPHVQNAITETTARELADAIEEIDSSHDAVVLTGKENVFSAGGDVNAMAERDETAKEAFDRVRATLGRAAEEILNAPVPIIAKVNGDAVGAGLSVVAAADFAYATESARFGATFINVGLIPDLGGTVTLPQIVGLRKAKELAFTGKLIDANEAADIGLINEYVPTEDIDSRVDSLIERLATLPTENIALTKQALHENMGETWQRGLLNEAKLQSIAYSTSAHEEGVNAFLESRAPKFK